MKKRDRGHRDKSEGKGVDDIISKTTGLNQDLKCQSIDEYQCTGNVEVDFLEVTALLRISEIPTVTHRQQAATSPSIERGVGDSPWGPKRQLLVDLESEDPKSVKAVKVFGWRTDEVMVKALNKILPSLNQLQTLHLWQAGLTPHTLASLRPTLPLCSNLRTVVLEGNPGIKDSLHLLLSEDSNIVHLSLRHNQIDKEGACLIGSALSTTQATNKNLISLNMAFNAIGDEGAKHIARGLRLNRSLLCLSLANNHIGDAGGASLAEILCPFPMCHEEIVERRRLLASRDQSPTPSDRPQSIPSSSSVDQGSNKGAKTSGKRKDKSSISITGPGKKDDGKMSKKMSDIKVQVPRTKQKSENKDRRQSIVDSEDKNALGQNKADGGEIASTLLDPGVQHVGGKFILPGNTALTSLNLAGNLLTECSMQLFCSSLQAQGDGAGGGGGGGGGLLRLSLSRNRFPSDCKAYLKIQEVMAQRDPLNKSSASQAEDGQGVAE